MFDFDFYTSLRIIVVSCPVVFYRQYQTMLRYIETRVFYVGIGIKFNDIFIDPVITKRLTLINVKHFYQYYLKLVR